MAPWFPLARGWERQLDIKDNALFYSGRLTAAPLRAPGCTARRAFRGRARRQARLLGRGGGRADRPRPAVPAPGASNRATGASTRCSTRRRSSREPPSLTRIGAELAHDSRRAARGSALIRVRWSPYWAVTQGSGCVGRADGFTRLRLRRAGPVPCGDPLLAQPHRRDLAAVQLTGPNVAPRWHPSMGSPPTPPSPSGLSARPASHPRPPIHRGAGLAARLAGPVPSDRCCSPARCCCTTSCGESSTATTPTSPSATP